MNYRAVCSVLRAEEVLVVEEVESLSRVVRGAQGLLQQLHNIVIEGSVNIMSCSHLGRIGEVVKVEGDAGAGSPGELHPLSP